MKIKEALFKLNDFCNANRIEYNKELMDKHGINASNPKLSKIGAIMADAFEKEGVYSLISPEVEHRLARAVETAAKELVKMM